MDRTLWDFDNNTSLTLTDIHNIFHLAEYKIPLQQFIKNYHRHNDLLWDLFRKNGIRKNELRKERFRRLFNEYNIYDLKLITNISEYYQEHSPKKSLLTDGALQTLEYLQHIYKLYIVSNGFYDAQITKMESAGISDFFTFVFTSDRVGHSKPDKLFFEYVIKSSNARKKESLVVGDDYINDVQGPAMIGIDQVWINSDNLKKEIPPTYSVKTLAEICTFL